MATKLKDLKVTKVDFVDAGANPGANIMIYKNKEGEMCIRDRSTYSMFSIEGEAVREEVPA